jgi:hypothetical protein
MKVFSIAAGLLLGEKVLILPTQADGAARSEFDRPARSPAPGAPAISAPPPTLPSKTPTRPQLLLNSAVLDRLGALAIYLRS